MNTFSLSNFKKGWIVGKFSPSIYDKDHELAIKYYNKGDVESSHYHKLSDEMTIIAYGSVKMNDVVYSTGDIIIQEKNEPTDFICLSDLVITVVYRPDGSFPNDKYHT